VFNKFSLLNTARYSSSVFKRELVNFNLDLLQLEHVYKGDQQNKLLEKVISENLVYTKLVNLVANKAADVDGLVSNVFINTADSINSKKFA